MTRTRSDGYVCMETKAVRFFSPLLILLAMGCHKETAAPRPPASETEEEDTGWMALPDDTDVTDDTDDTDVTDDTDDTDDTDVPTLGTWYLDIDGDGYGQTATAQESEHPYPGYVALGGDCDDTDPAVFPGAVESCNRADDDCDGQTDEELPLQRWYLDADSDGFGDPGTPVESCAPVLGTVEDATDCDDQDPTVNPGVPEECDDMDQNCDGQADEGLIFLEWYWDGDGDGYGDPSMAGLSCGTPVGYVRDATDCDDAFSDTNPGATEICGDGRDNDCDGTINTCGLREDLDTSQADAHFAHNGTSVLAGIKVESAGDVNGDGYDEYVTGLAETDVYQGTAYVSGLSTTDPGTEQARIIEYDSNDGSGTAIAPLGDLDGDGFDDLVLGAPDALSGRGAAVVAFGPLTGDVSMASSNLIYQGSWGTGLGNSVAGIGDVDADGSPDLAISGSDGGIVYIVTETITKTQGTHFIRDDVTETILIDSILDSSGSQVMGLGDLNADGFDDIGVSLPWASASQGALMPVAIFNGPMQSSDNYSNADSLLRRASTGLFAIDGLGFSVDAAGDVNGDGYDDLIVGSNAGTGSPGVALLFQGPLDPTQLASAADAVLLGENLGDLAGWSVAGVGDLDRDGLDDLAIGAPYYDNGNGQDGRVYVVHGDVTGEHVLSEFHTIDSSATSPQRLGFSVAGAGDVDGDGSDDLVVGAPLDSTSDPNGGSAYLFLGSGL